MSLKTLTKIKAEAPHGVTVSWDVPTDAVTKWDASLALAKSNDNTITIYDQIGYDSWTGEGVTAKRIAGALRSIGERDVEVSINSPGGDFFEGVAIYNLLAEHPHKVTVKVVGEAASAASIIAMAGDEIQVAKSGWLMIHNAWAFVMGNRHDLSSAAEVLSGFDDSMAQLYADATGLSKQEAMKMMDAETWLNGEQAVALGFATMLLGEGEVSASASSGGMVSAFRKVDKLLAQQGVPRVERRSLLRQMKEGTPSAAMVTPSAGLLEEIKQLSKSIRGK